MIAGRVAHRERPHAGRHFAVAHRQMVGRIIGQRVAAGLRLQQQRESGIAADIDPLDRIHLDGDVQGHGSSDSVTGVKQRTRSARPAAKLYAIFVADRHRAARQRSAQREASKALAMWRGILPGTTSITSKRMSAWSSSGWLASQNSAAAMMRRLSASVTASAASSKRVARLDLDEDQRAAAAGDDIDLAERRFPAPRHDAIGLGDQQHRGAALGRKAEPECREAFRARRSAA